MFGIRKAHQLASAAAVIEVPVGTAATSEAALSELDPVAAAAFGIGDAGGRVTRKQAMKVPSIRRGRNLICGTASGLPLVGVKADGQPADANSSTARLLRTLDPRTTPAYTLAWTFDDLLFHQLCWWRTTGRDSTRYPVTIERLAPGRVQVTPAGAVLVDGREADDADLIRFDSPLDGLLVDDGAGTVVRLALALLGAAKRQADDDWSGLILRLAEGAPELSMAPSSAGDGTTRSQVDALLDTWEEARAARSTAYLNRAIDPEKISVGAAERQLNELSQLVASEIARLLNLPASRIGAPQGSGMTYTNTESDRRDLVDTTLSPFLTAVHQRLSMPDVTPAGTAVVHDLTAYLRGTTTELVSAGNEAVAGDLVSRAEVRTRWLGLPPAPEITDKTTTTTTSEDA